jgi:DNA repair exonuclease SbcCD nuclease subunit
LRAAQHYDVAAILMAGDLFDSAEPHEDWWRGFAEALTKGTRGWERPIVLLPGNHDPVRVGSVYHREHAFRHALPTWVHVVDAPGFELPLGEHAVVLANPCTTEAGAEDLALALPARAPGDTRLRIGLVHGSTFDLEGHQTNFPIAADAPVQRGLDYLAIGDTHGYRILPREDAVAPIVYPGAPEPTRLGEQGAGGVVIVHLERPGVRPQLVWERVGEWTFRDEIIENVASLRVLARELTSKTVLQLRLTLTVSPADAREVERLLVTLEGDRARRGKVGAVLVDRTAYRVRAEAPENLLSGAPDAVQDVAQALMRDGSDEAARALRLLADLYAEVSS